MAKVGLRSLFGTRGVVMDKEPGTLPALFAQAAKMEGQVQSRPFDNYEDLPYPRSGDDPTSNVRISHLKKIQMKYLYVTSIRTWWSLWNQRS